MCSDWLKFQRSSCQKRYGQWNHNCAGMLLGWSSTKFMFFFGDPKSKMAATAEYSLTLDPMGKTLKSFFSETTKSMKIVFCRNVPWMVLYKVYVFFADRKSKMAATAEHSLTLDPMGHTFEDLLLRNQRMN